jgi:hypothetical protein
VIALLTLWLYLPTGYEHALDVCGDWHEARSWQRTGRCTFEPRTQEAVV